MRISGFVTSGTIGHPVLLVARSRYSFSFLITQLLIGKSKKLLFLGENKKPILLYCTVDFCTVLYCTAPQYLSFCQSIFHSHYIQTPYFLFLCFLHPSCYQHIFHNTHNLFLFLRNTLLSMFSFNMLL